MKPYELRPLGFGDLLDRAVALCVRHSGVLLTIVALASIPLAIAQYVIDPAGATGGIFAELRELGKELERARHPPTHTPPLTLHWPDVALIAGSIVVSALASVACSITVRRAYAGLPIAIGVAYLQSVRRWRALVVAGAATFGIGIALAVVALGGLALLALAVATIAQVAGWNVASFVVAPFILAGLALFFVLFALVSFVGLMMLVSIGLDDERPMRGVGRAIRRTFGGANFKRAFVAALIATSISFAGTQMLAALGDAVRALTLVDAFSWAIQSLGGVGVDLLVTTFVTVFAIDLSIRREGYDLVVAARSDARSNPEPALVAGC